MRLPRLLSSVFLVLGLSVATTALAENVTITENARQHFKAGVAYIEDPAGAKYEEAYREFVIAYEDSPSYKILNNIGLCALSLERDGEAIDAYENFLAQATPADIPADKRAQMERDISMLKASLVKVTVTSSPSEVALIDERITSGGQKIINRYDLKAGQAALGLHPGQHRISAKANGYESQTWEFDADSASTQTHDFKLAPPSTAPAPVAVATPPQTPTKPSIPTLVYVGAAATGVFAIGATVTGILYTSKKSDYNDANDGTNPKHADDLKGKAETLALVTDIGIGAALVSATATAVLYFTRGSGETKEKTPNTAWQIAPALGAQYAGMDVTGRF